MIIPCQCAKKCAKAPAILTRSRNATQTIGPSVDFAQLTDKVSDPAP